MKVAGLALAAAIANTVNAVRLTHRLEQRLNAPLLAPVVEPLGRMLLASVAMGAVCLASWHALSPHVPAWVALLIVVPTGVAAYGIGCRLFAVQETSTLSEWLG